jgi:hypothetical protein
MRRRFASQYVTNEEEWFILLVGMVILASYLAG